MGTAKNYPVKRIILLGASGQIGSFIYQYLKQNFPDIFIKACIRQIPDKANAHAYTLFHPFTDHWQQLGYADVLINCIGIIRETNNFSFEQAHTGLTKLILHNRQKIGNPKIIQISALGADPHSPVAFLSTKGRADELLLKCSNTCVVRPSIVCTADTMVAQKLKLLSRLSRYLMNYLPFPEHILQTQIQPIMPEDLAALIAKLCFTEDHPAIINAV